MSRRGAGIGRKLEQAYPAEREGRALELMVTPALGRIVMESVQKLRAGGAKPPEIASLLAHAAASLAQQGGSALSRDEWLTLCAVLWDGPDGSPLVSSPGGDA